MRRSLDLFSSLTAPSIHLQRRVKYHAANEVTPDRVHAEKPWSDISEFLAPGVWRLSLDSTAQSDDMRILEGEIHLAKDLVPSSAIAHYAVEVRKLSQCI